MDIGYLPKSVLSSLTPTLETTDLKYASTFLDGRDLLGEIPNFDSRDISPYEFARLICNRTAGLLSARLPRHTDSVQYRTNQYVKACIAVGDVAVYLGRGYNPSYRKRMDTFKSIAQEGQINSHCQSMRWTASSEGTRENLETIPALFSTSMRH